VAQEAGILSSLDLLSFVLRMHTMYVPEGGIKRQIYGVSIRPGQALMIGKGFLSGKWEHATLPAVPFGQEVSKNIAIVVLRYKLLLGKAPQDVISALSATKLETKVVKNLVLPGRKSPAVISCLTDEVKGKVKGETIVLKVLLLPPLLEGGKTSASGLSVLGKSGAGAKVSGKAQMGEFRAGERDTVGFIGNTKDNATGG